MDKVSLSEKFSRITEQWKPKIVGELNGQQVTLVKFQGRLSGTTTTMRTSCSSSWRVGSAWSSATGTFGWRRASF